MKKKKDIVPAYDSEESLSCNQKDNFSIFS